MDLLAAKGPSSSSSYPSMDLLRDLTSSPSSEAPRQHHQQLYQPAQHLPYPSYPLQQQQQQDEGLPPYMGGEGPLLAPPPHASAAGVPSGAMSPSLPHPSPSLLHPQQPHPQQPQPQQQQQQHYGGMPMMAHEAPPEGQSASSSSTSSQQRTIPVPNLGAPTSGSNSGPSSHGNHAASLLPSYPPHLQQAQAPVQQQQQQGAPSSVPPYYAPQQQATVQHAPQQAYGGAPGAARAAPGSYPAIETVSSARDPVQNLLDAYPNPQTENQKIIKMLELIVSHMQQQYKRFDSFMSSVEERLGGLEAALSQMALNDPEIAKRMEALAQRETMERERERERNAARGPSFYPMASSPKAGKSDLKKKKKKKVIVPEYDREIVRGTAPDFGHRSAASAAPASDEVDEELARKLQAQFNAEAEIEALKRESLSLSDEEYAQKLQSLYLKRDAASGQAAKRTTPAATKSEEQPKKPEGTSKLEEKSLWSRLFGAPKAGSDEESDDEDATKSTKKTTEVTTIYPAAGASTRAPVAQPVTVGPAAAGGAGSQMVMPYYYPGMPQQPFVLPQGMPQYAPYPVALQPGTQYLYPATQPPSAQPQ